MPRSSKSFIEPHWTKKSNLSLVEVKFVWLSSTKFYHTNHSKILPRADTLNLFISSLMLIRNDSGWFEESLQTLLKKIITTNLWGLSKVSRGLMKGSRKDKNQFGLNLLRNNLKWHLLWDTRALWIQPSNQVLHKILNCWLKKGEFGETESILELYLEKI